MFFDEFFKFLQALHLPIVREGITAEWAKRAVGCLYRLMKHGTLNGACQGEITLYNKNSSVVGQWNRLASCCNQLCLKLATFSVPFVFNFHRF